MGQLTTALNFAKGTTEATQKEIMGLIEPAQLLGAYQESRQRIGNPDLVIVISKSDMSMFQAEPRMEYVSKVRRGMSSRDWEKVTPIFGGLWHNSAQSVEKLPRDSDAFWLVVTRGQEMPIMAVLYSLQYEQAGAGVPLIGEA